MLCIKKYDLNHYINGDNMEIFAIIIKTLMLYLIIFVIFRILDKRRVTQLRVGDLGVILLIFNIMLWGYNNNFILSLILILLILFLEGIVYKHLNKSDSYNKVIVNRGKVNFEVMLRENYNIEELYKEIKKNNIDSIFKIDYAILDKEGKLNLFINEEDYPLPLILEGKIIENTLLQIEKDEKWLNKALKEQGYLLKDIFYGFYVEGEVFFIKKHNTTKYA